MMASSNGNIFLVTGILCREFPSQRPVTQSFDVFFDLRLNKRLSNSVWNDQSPTRSVRPDFELNYLRIAVSHLNL